MELPEYTGDMTRKLFYEDSHRKEFEARVLFCAACKEGGGFWTVLDQTCFFPEGGGQYADTGYLGEVKVLDARERDGVVYHRTEAPLEPGDLVCGRIDWEERFEKMQQHTGEHIVSGLVHSRFGYNDFILPLGYKGEVIKQYFADYHRRNTNFTVSLKTGDITTDTGEIEDWRVTLCDTGAETLKGGRLKRVARYIDTDRFMVTYGDGVADIDIDALVRFHKESGCIGTFTGVRMPCRFGAVRTDETGRITSWEEKPILNEYINCGFFVFKREFLDYLSEDESCDLEKEPLQRLAAACF